MIDVKRIFPECNADTLLVELILQRGRPAHYHGINKVGKALISYPKDSFIIGLIDTDKFKKKDPNIELFTELVDDRLSEENILIKKLPGTNKYILRIHPEFEPWIWDLALKCNVNPNDTQYGFETLNKLKDASKKEDVFENKKFKKFVNAVIRQNPPAIQTLKFWLDKAKDV